MLVGATEAADAAEVINSSIDGETADAVVTDGEGNFNDKRHPSTSHSGMMTTDVTKIDTQDLLSIRQCRENLIENSICRLPKPVAEGTRKVAAANLLLILLLLLIASSL